MLVSLYTFHYDCIIMFVTTGKHLLECLRLYMLYILACFHLTSSYVFNEILSFHSIFCVHLFSLIVQLHVVCNFLSLYLMPVNRHFHSLCVVHYWGFSIIYIVLSHWLLRLGYQMTQAATGYLPIWNPWFRSVSLCQGQM